MYLGSELAVLELDDPICSHSSCFQSFSPPATKKATNPHGSCYVTVLIAGLLMNFFECLQDTQADKRALAVRYIWMHCSSKGNTFRTACCKLRKGNL